MKEILSEAMLYRGKSDLPIFCRPIPLFIAMWIIMLGSLQMHVTDFAYPDISLAVGLFALSLASLLVGCLVTRLVLSYDTRPFHWNEAYRIDLKLLRRAEWCLTAIIMIIVLANFAAYGLPPLFSLLGATTLSYVEYGKLKQVLNAATMALTVAASLETSRFRKTALYAFTFLSMAAYATRGFTLVMLAQAFFVFCLRTRTSKKKLYIVAVSTVFAAVLISNLIGNGRAESTTEAFVAFFGISDTYAKWPMATLWMLSYISTPVSNLCWIVHSYHYTHPTATFLTTLVPAFWAPPALENNYLGSPFIIDGVHTYLAKYYLDLWYFGIILINLVWGIIATILTRRGRLVKCSLTSSVLLAAIVFIFYADFLTFLSIAMELIALAVIEQFALLPQSNPAPPTSGLSPLAL